MKRIFSAILAIVTITAFTTACSESTPSGGTAAPASSAAAPSEKGGDAATDEKEFSLKVGDNWGVTHPMAAALDNVFKTQIEEKSGGKIKVEVYHDGLLGDEAALWQGVRDGSIDFAVVGTPMNQEFTMMLISDWPFLYRDLDHAKKVWTGSIADEVNAKFHEKFPEVEILGWGPNSARTFTSNKPLTSVEDFAGQKFRMPNNPIHVGITENLGASPTVIPLGELFTALETGTVDGQDNGMVTVIAQNFQEVQKYLYETNHIVATLEIVANSDKLAEMSDNQRQIIVDAGKATAEQAWVDYIASVDKDRKTLEEAGMTVTACTAEDKAKIIEKIQPTLDKLLAENDWAEDLITKINAVE
ncbi:MULTISPECIES: TRAP transporter substrate-binding protein [Anaerotruncus]|jgi:tripartite ATP-independent transporter DctP family solute receptor|uniref:TRAP transporter substrate-binding protein n=1 Tax=Anaerotruncus TaxID=244127 RepID=UPI000E4DB0DC|nr:MULTISPECIES: TRAP transporter substrate-binding protein [Anaerotruncus]RGX54069.1 C4-dicarboxylate ABC transporter substrate-binding protein [Anaerotruncus sp. AF02-27]